MKLVIQIAALNEEATLPGVLRALPTTLPPFDSVEWLVVDDGSSDRTAEVASSHGAIVVRLPARRGLARAFAAGLDAALARGADVIVNTDADGQYRAQDIPALLAPILRGEADIVIGARPISTIASFSWTKRRLQALGSWVVRRLSSTAVTDAPSGFRAYSREAAIRINVFSRYTYSLETIVQAAQRGARIVSVPIGVDPVTRPSRLMTSQWNYIWRAGSDLVRMFVVYRPFRSFMIPALASAVAGIAIGLRFLWLYWQGGGTAGNVQSLILAAILLGIAGTLALAAFLGDLLAINRQLLEEVKIEARRARLDAAVASLQRARQ